MYNKFQPQLIEKGMMPMAKELLVTPIFRSVNPKKTNEMTSVTTKNQKMEVTVKGAQLNTKVDLLLFMMIIHRFAATPNASSVSFTLREIILHLGYTTKKVDSKRRKMVSDSLNRLSTSSINIRWDNGREYLYFSMLSCTRVSLNDDTATIEISDTMRDLYLNSPLVLHISYETIQKLDADARSVYMYIKHTNTVDMTITHKTFKEYFAPRCCPKRYRAKLEKALNNLAEHKIITYSDVNDYGFDISKVNFKPSAKKGSRGNHIYGKSAA